MYVGEWEVKWEAGTGDWLLNSMYIGLRRCILNSESCWRYWSRVTGGGAGGASCGGGARYVQPQPPLHGRGHPLLLADHRQLPVAVLVLSLGSLRSQGDGWWRDRLLQLSAARDPAGQERAAGAGVRLGVHPLRRPGRTHHQGRARRKYTKLVFNNN